MLTILRFRGFNILIYTLDHAPAHVHVVGKGGRGTFYLGCDGSGVSLRGAIDIPARDITLLIGFFRQNHDILCEPGEFFIMTNDLLDDEATRVYGEPFKSLGFRFSAAHFDPATQQIHVELENGLKIHFHRNLSKAFTKASDAELSELQVYAWTIDFPRIDDGFSLEPLAFGDFGNPPWDSAFLQKMQVEKEHLPAA